MKLNESTFLRFAPGTTAVVRGPRSVQFGADATRSGVVDAPSAAALVKLLQELKSPTRLDTVLARAESVCGFTPEETMSLVNDLVAYRVLVAHTPRGALIIGRSAVSTALLQLLASARIHVRTLLPGESIDRFLSTTDPTAPMAVVDNPLSAMHLAHLTRHRPGPVISVTLVDARVFIGPLGPCLYCAHLYHVDRDANWLHVARMLREASPTPDPLVVSAGAAAVARIMRRLCGAPDPPGVSAPAPPRGTQIVVDPFAPEPISQHQLGPHPSCPVCF
ncbi:hypothetical protein [Corynebacterium mayonis]|uniref:hypothetical protein n=1 Tax=Corynebacterium mayonis TaxID=3062461 RepID=UPI003140143A